MVDFNYLRQVSHSTSMLDVLDFYGIEYHNAGTDRYKCLCPFHDDHNPSLIIYTSGDHKDESFCCYVDNNAGDSFLFIRLMESGDFRKAWSILCHLNGIEDTDADEVSELDLLLRPSQSTNESASTIHTINHQISKMYRNFYKEQKEVLSPERLICLTEVIDKRFKNLDDFISTNPSYVDMHQYFKFELDRLKKLREDF